MLCSVLIPSRDNPSGLIRAILSLYENAQDHSHFEVLVRLDDDDAASIAAIPQIEAIHKNIQVTVGNRKKGYDSMCDFIEELAEKARGYWVTMIDDDVTLDGKHWDVELAKVPHGTGTFVQPEFLWLGRSKYGSGSCGVVGWIVPNQSWKPNKLSSPVDQHLYDLLVSRSKWNVRLLPGIIYNHQHWKKDPTNQPGLKP